MKRDFRDDEYPRGVAVVSEESESVDADAEGSPDIDDKELR